MSDRDNDHGSRESESGTTEKATSGVLGRNTC